MNTTARCAWMLSRLWWKIGRACRSCVDIRNDRSIWYSRW